jgi:hypothetical protein
MVGQEHSMPTANMKRSESTGSATRMAGVDVGLPVKLLLRKPEQFATDRAPMATDEIRSGVSHR